MQNHDPQDEFAELCHRYREYPKFQLHTQSPQEAWYNETQWDKLQEKEKTVFCATHENIDVWETGGLNSNGPAFNLVNHGGTDGLFRIPCPGDQYLRCQ